MTQADAILADLRRGEQITALDALRRHGCLRLAARIKDLRSQGHVIAKEMIEVESGKKVARYSMRAG